MKSIYLPKAISTDIVVQELPTEILVYNLNTNKAVCLNQTSAFVWNSCDGTTDINQLLTLFEKKFNSKIDTNFINLALDELNSAGLLETYSPQLTNKISRRKALLNIGLSLAVFPVVTILTAPTAANAASSACVAETCSTAADCTQASCPSACTDNFGVCDSFACNNGCCQATSCIINNP